MKKSLVALAALAATASFAQVTLDGYMDRGYASTSNTLSTKNAKNISSNAGTTTFGIKVNENLSSDLSMGVWISTDWNDIGGASQDNNALGSAPLANKATAVTTSTGRQAASTYALADTTAVSTVSASTALTNPVGASTMAITNLGAFANSQNFLRLTSKSMGELRLGTPNNFTLTNATAVAQPLLSTGIGSAYSSSFSIANGMGTGTTGGGGIVNLSAPVATAGAVSNAGQRAIRNPNTIQYQSPSINGFVVGYGQTLKNANASVSAGGSTRTSTSDTVGVTEYMLRYTNGPIDAMYTSIKYDTSGIAGLNFGNALGGDAGSGVATKNTQNLLGATYTVMPSLKLHAGFGNFSSDNDTIKGKSTQYGATYTVGQWDVMAQMAKVDDQTTTSFTNGVGTGVATQTNMDRKMTGLGVNYNLSKTTRAYVRYDNINYYSNGTAVEGTSQKRTALGMSISY